MSTGPLPSRGVVHAGGPARLPASRTDRRDAVGRRTAFRGLALLVGSVRAQAQQAERQRRIGILMPYPAADAVVRERVEAFKREPVRPGPTGIRAKE